MKKVISIILALVLCLGCCFALSACSDGETTNGPFDTQTQMYIAEISLHSIAYRYSIWFGINNLTEQTTIGEVENDFISRGLTIGEYAYIDKNTKFLDVFELDEERSEVNGYDFYRVKSDISPSEYYSASDYDLDTAKRIIVEDSLNNILEVVDSYKLKSQIDDEMTIQEVVTLIESKGEEVSLKHLNTSCIFLDAVQFSYFDGIQSSVRNDVELLDYFAE